METIKPTTIPEKDKPYILEDKDYLLIKAIQDLTASIKLLSLKI